MSAANVGNNFPHVMLFDDRQMLDLMTTKGANFFDCFRE
jgi:hypothetical protein